MTEYTYRAERTADIPRVFVSSFGKDEELLTADRSVRRARHSKHLDWGFRGARAVQLALAILLRETSYEEALRRYQRFHEAVISKLPHDAWQLTSSTVLGWLNADRVQHPLKEEESCSS